MFKTFTVAVLLCALLSNALASKSCFGCPKVESVETQDVQDAVKFAVGQLKAESIDNVRTIAAAVQVVNGLNYHLTFETQRDVKLDVFKAVVYRNISASVNADDAFSVISMDALISRRAGASCAGCVHDISVSDENVLKAGSFAWSELEKLEDDVDMSIGKNFKVHAAGVQTVNGLNYYLLLEGEFDNIQVQHTATVYKDFSNQHYLTRSTFSKALIQTQQF